MDLGVRAHHSFMAATMLAGVIMMIRAPGRERIYRFVLIFEYCEEHKDVAWLAGQDAPEGYKVVGKGQFNANRAPPTPLVGWWAWGSVRIGPVGGGVAWCGGAPRHVLRRRHPPRPFPPPWVAVCY